MDKPKTPIDQQLLADELETVRWFAEDKHDATRYVGWESVCARVPELKSKWATFLEQNEHLQQEIDRAKNEFYKAIEKAIERTGCRPQNE